MIILLKLYTKVALEVKRLEIPLSPPFPKGETSFSLSQREIERDFERF